MSLMNIVGRIFGSKQDRDVKGLNPVLDRVNGFPETMHTLSDEQLQDKTAEFRQRLTQGETLDDILPEAFSVVREVTHRVLGEGRVVKDPYTKKEIPFMAHFDVQIMGGVVLHQGKIAEMKTGEGKTQVATLAAYLNALEGRGVHVITVNDYLARRDSEWMGKIFSFLGLTVGCLDNTEPSSEERREAYNCDITYGTNNEFGFDYLRDNMAFSADQCVQRELNYAIIDEVDNILVDEARTPLIISGPVTKSNKEYEELRPRVEKAVSAQKNLIKKLFDEAQKLLDDEEKHFEAGLKLLAVRRGSPKYPPLLNLLKEPGIGKIMKSVEAEYLRERKLHEIDEQLFFSIDESGHSAELTEKGRRLISESDPYFFVVPDLAETLNAVTKNDVVSIGQKAKLLEFAQIIDVLTPQERESLVASIESNEPLNYDMVEKIQKIIDENRGLNDTHKQKLADFVKQSEPLSQQESTELCDIDAYLYGSSPGDELRKKRLTEIVELYKIFNAGSSAAYRDLFEKIKDKDLLIAQKREEFEAIIAKNIPLTLAERNEIIDILNKDPDSDSRQITTLVDALKRNQILTAKQLDKLLELIQNNAFSSLPYMDKVNALDEDVRPYPEEKRTDLVEKVNAIPTLTQKQKDVVIKQVIKKCDNLSVIDIKKLEALVALLQPLSADEKQTITSIVQSQAKIIQKVQAEVEAKLAGNAKLSSDYYSGLNHIIEIDASLKEQDKVELKKIVSIYYDWSKEDKNEALECLKSYDSATLNEPKRLCELLRRETAGDQVALARIADAIASFADVSRNEKDELYRIVSETNLSADLRESLLSYFHKYDRLDKQDQEALVHIVSDSAKTLSSRERSQLTQRLKNNHRLAPSEAKQIKQALDAAKGIKAGAKEIATRALRHCPAFDSDERARLFEHVKSIQTVDVNQKNAMLERVGNNLPVGPEESQLLREDAQRQYTDKSERIHSASQLLRAYSMFERDVDYVVQDGQILIVDEFTGRILHGRRYSEGLHQALEAKERVRVAGENQTLATITFQNFFKMYRKIAGMTGTAATEAGEFHDIYKLDVVTIPTNRPLARTDYDDEIYKTQKEKVGAIADEISHMNEEGRPVLVGTTSIEKSEVLSKKLTQVGVQHSVLNAKQHSREAHIVAQAGRIGGVTIATNMAGRGTDIVLGGNFEAMVNQELAKEGIEADDLSREERRERYAKLFRELQEEQKKVKELGGLHIIGTERHEARRIDNQLRGRAGRQGDPGSSKFFLSLDDDLMRIFGSERLVGIMDRLGAEDGEAISHPLVSRSIGSAQKRVEGRNFDQRKHLKEYDDVMNLQRTEIYGLRQQILRGENIKHKIMEQISIFLEELVLRHTEDSKYAEQWHLKDLYVDLQAGFGIIYSIPEEQVSSKSIESLYDDIGAEIKKAYDEREQSRGELFMRSLERSIFLMVIDNLWKDHLYEMDHLKQGVQFRSYAQKNPLYEYQKEALNAFAELRSTIARQVTMNIFRYDDVVEQQDRMGLNRAQTEHDSYNVFAGPGSAPASDGSVPAAARKRRMITNRAGGGKPAPVRAPQQVGRNDPCPCGSGKKYKKCCGKTTA
ncbi:MAG: preprotein translocase subunit SecA [Chitinivibrionales bacterium]|nr:preprotein translocase subunit SecA [Chitinivibrionales bacterium]